MVVAVPAGVVTAVVSWLLLVGAALEDGCAVIGGVGADAIDFGLDRLEFRIQRLALRAVIDGAVGRLGGQGDGAIQQGGDLRQGAIGDLQFAHTFIGVHGGLGKGGDVGLQSIGNGQAGCIIGAGIDPRARGQLLQGLLQVRLGDRQLVLRGKGWNVIQNTDCHGIAPLSWFHLARARLEFVPAGALPGFF